MAEYIEKEAIIKKINSRITPTKDSWDFGYNMAMAEAKAYIENAPAADVQLIKELQEQIASVKRSVKSDNSDYLTGYISALSAVEGLIAEKLEK